MSFNLKLVGHPHPGALDQLEHLSEHIVLLLDESFSDKRVTLIIRDESGDSHSVVTDDDVLEAGALLGSEVSLSWS